MAHPDSRSFALVSAGYVRADYNALIGWEEGTVEHLQRLLRRRVLDALGVDAAEEVFAETEAKYPFNPYINALEDVRDALGVPPLDFYLRLLRTPIAQRPASIFGQTVGQSGAVSQQIIQILSRSNAVLKEVIRHGYY